MKHILFVFLAVCLLALTAQAQVPKVISHQGYLTDNAGQPVTGYKLIVVRMFTEKTGGTAVLTQSTDTVKVTNGIYSVNIDVSWISFNTQYWLELEVNGQVLSPRTQLTSIPYALGPWTQDDSTWIQTDSTHPDMSVNNIYYNSGNVGIGTTTPTEKLSVAGNARFEGTVFAHEFSSLSPNIISSPPSPGQDDIIFRPAQTEAMRIKEGGYVGIGTPDPDVKLHVVGSVKIADGTQGSGKILTSDAAGVASWQTPSGGGSGWSLTGNFGTNPNANFLGTTDAAPLFFKVDNQKAGTIYKDGSVFLGYQAGNVSPTTGNTGIGNRALKSNTTGTYNTAIGTLSLTSNTTGYGNTAFGDGSLASNTTGYWNAALGDVSLANNTTGHNNVAIGHQTLTSNTIGYYNAVFGNEAGYYNSTGSGNVFLGNQAGYNETGSNKLYIANNNISAPLIYGDFSTGAVGLGTTIPAERLDVVGTVKMLGFKLPVGAGSGLILKSDANGNGTWQSSALSGIASGDLSGSYPDPTVERIKGTPLGSTTANDRFILVANGILWNSVLMHGDAMITNTGSVEISPNAITSDKIFDNSVTGDDIATGTITGDNIAEGYLTLKNTAVELSNDDGGARSLIFYEPSTAGNNYTSFSAKAQAANISYVLPPADGTAGQVLSTNASGILSWTSDIPGNAATATYATTAGTANYANTAGTATYANTAGYAGTAGTAESLSTVLGIVNGGTGSSTPNFVGLTGTQNIGGAKTFLEDLNVDCGKAYKICGLQVLSSTGTQNIFVGTDAGHTNTTGNNNTSLGYRAGYNNSTGNGSVFLGNQAGYNETGSNKLYIANSSSNPPLIYGDFSAGKVGIGTTSPTATLDIVGSTGYNQLRMRTSYTPTGSTDANGNIGDIAWDDNYVYVKTSTGWKRSSLGSW